MKRLRGLLEGGWGLLVLVGLVGLAAVWLLFLRANSLPREVAQTSRFASPFNPTPSEPTRVEFQSPLPQIEPTVLPSVSPVTRPPLCQFEQAGVSEAESPSRLDRFVFSEPQVIFSREAAIEIIEWLPDNRWLLVHVRDQTKQSIEVLDTVTGQTEVYADGLQSANEVHWVAGENAVVYTENRTLEISGIRQFAVWLSRGKGAAAQLLLEVDNADILRAKGNAQKIPSGIAQAFNLYDFPFDPELWRYNKYPENSFFMESWAEVKFGSSVSPDGSKAVFYRVPWLYLVDVKTGQPCEINLGQYIRANTVLWSPDSRLLAMIVRQTELAQELPPFSHLVFLNIQTGDVYQPDLEMRHIWEMAWASDSRYFITMGEIGDSENSYLKQKLALVDVLGKSSKSILPTCVFGGAQPGFQLALSPDSKALSVNCPIVSDEFSLGLKDQVCLISIK